MRIMGVGTASPEHSYTQEELTDTITKVWGDEISDRQVSRINQMHKSVLVKTRQLALPIEDYKELDSFTKANQAFIRVGADLGVTVISEALEAAGLSPQDLDAIFFTTVTGLAVPTIDARLVNRLNLRSDIKRIPLFGLGCVAGVAGISRMHDYLKAWPEHTAVLLSVELCSLTLQSSDFSVANIIATGLFGDGAAAVVCVGDDYQGRENLPASSQKNSPTTRKTKSSFYRDTEDVMGWDIGSDGFKIVLNAKVPEMVTEFLAADVDSFLAENQLTRDDISSWICHTGGPKVLIAMQDALGLSPDQLAITWKSLEDLGNLSSASVLFVLKETLANQSHKPGDYGLMIAMGPGFCSELVLIQW